MNIKKNNCEFASSNGTWSAGHVAFSHLEADHVRR